MLFPPESCKCSLKMAQTKHIRSHKIHIYNSCCIWNACIRTIGMQDKVNDPAFQAEHNAHKKQTQMCLRPAFSMNVCHQQTTGEAEIRRCLQKAPVRWDSPNVRCAPA